MIQYFAKDRRTQFALRRKIMFDKFLESRKAACKALAEKLQESFSYVGILGSHVLSSAIRVNRKTSSVGELPESDCGFVIKLNDGGIFYEYSLDDIGEDTDALAEKIIKEIKLGKSLECRAISIEAIPSGSLEKHFERETDTNNYSDAQLLEFCTGVKDKILAADKRIINALCMLRIFEVNKMFVGANRTLTQHYAWINGYAIAVMRDGDKMVQARETANSHLIKDVIELLPQKIDKLVEKAEHLLSAKPITPGVYDVITDPSITGLIAHEAFGHGVEMDQFVKDRALAKQFVGKSVASPICNMRDGAGSCLSVASYFFDDDGVLAGDTQIIKNGILVGGLCDLTSSAQLKYAPTGNGRRESHTHKAYARMTNTFFERGSDKLEDMIASVKHGYMLFETNNGMEDPKNWAIQCTAEYGIEIVDGKLTENYVSPVVMSGYVPDLLKSIDMISDGMEIEGSGMCGKGYKEWVRVSDGGPALKARVKLG